MRGEHNLLRMAKQERREASPRTRDERQDERHQRDPNRPGASPGSSPPSDEPSTVSSSAATSALGGGSGGGQDVTPDQCRPAGERPQVAAGVYKISMDEYGIYNRPSSRGALGQPAGAAGQPIIIVEPRNDDSMRCDCRNCQFFSGWCCFPCLLFVLLGLLVTWLCLRDSWQSAGGSDEPPSTGSGDLLTRSTTWRPPHYTVPGPVYIGDDDNDSPGLVID